MRRAEVAILALVPVLLPLLVLAASPGRLLPGLPHYRYQPLPGDAYAYYSCVRELISTAGRAAPLVLLAAALGGGLVLLARRRRVGREWLVVAVSCAIGLVAAVLAERVRFTGAPQVGWSLLLSIPMLPLRVIGAGGPRAAFVAGLVLSIAANVVTVGATLVIARRLGLPRWWSLFAAALVALWPLISLLTGHRAAWNGTWQVWLGLSLYTEPISTAAVTVALALLLSPPARLLDYALAGSLLGFATLVRVSNVLVVLVALAVLAVTRSLAAAAPFAAAALAWAPAVLLYWPKGYPKLGPPTFPAHPFALSYASHAWTSSYLWHPWVLLVLVPLIVVGTISVRPRAGALLGGAVGLSAAFYTFYEETPIHPRFLFVVVPAALVLWVAGGRTAIARVERR